MLRKPKPTVTQSKYPAAKGSRSGVALHGRGERAGIEQAVSSPLQHAAVDVGQPDLAAWRHASHQALARSPLPLATSSTALARPRARKLDGERTSTRGAGRATSGRSSGS